jgi:hypothetical protein
MNLMENVRTVDNLRAAYERIQGRWSSLRDILSVQRRVTASFQRAESGALHIRKATRPEPELAAIYQALNLDPLSGGVQKTTV